MSETIDAPLPRPKAATPVDGALSILPKGPRLMEFLTHPAPVCVCMGPYGSGKTTALFLKLLLCSVRVPPSPLDGVRYARTAIVRDTYRNLELNTIPSWEERFPRQMGEWRGGGNGEPAKARLRFALNDGSELDWEVIFTAIGDHNVKEFCDGLQLTNCGIDGVDAMPPDLLRIHMPFRLGRWPDPKHRPPNWQDFIDDACKLSGVMNAPDMDNYTYADFIDKPRKGWKLVIQPGGMEPDAENIENLPGRRGYYEKKLESLNEWDANRFVHNKFGYSRSGTPVYPEFNDNLHVAKLPLKFNPARPLHVGIDGGRDCCAVFLQRSLSGRIDILAELVPDRRMGGKQFGPLVERFIEERFPDAKVIKLHPDPATDNPDPNDDDAVWIDLFLSDTSFTRADVFLPASNAFNPRREAVATPMRELEDGKPNFQLDPSCRMLRGGFNSGYRFEVVASKRGDPLAKPEPEKNQYSHPHDAAQYGCLGAMGLATITGGRYRKKSKPVEETTWDPHAY